jgi:hypothetical protein
MLDKEIIIRRLAAIKYLYNIGIQQSMQVETVAGFSILSFHDCAEMFLLLVAENKGDNADNISFMGYWDKYSELTLKESMRNLKDRRISIKHKGQFPSKSDIEISRITMTDFLEQNIPKQFGLEFKDISISNLVSYKEVRTYVYEAEKDYNEEKLYDSIVNAKIAFMELLSTYEQSKCKNYLSDSILNIGEDVGNDYKRLVGTDDKLGARWFEKVSTTVNKIREILKIMALGIDYKKYAYFEIITPKVNIWWKDGVRDYESLPKEYYENVHELRKENCKFCIDFVIDSALKLQEFDYDINKILK